MLIIGCDFHTGYQQIAMMDTANGELIERRLEHIVISRGLALKKLAHRRSMERKERNMRKPVILTGRIITPEESARLYGLSKRHAKRLIDMVEKSLAKRSYSHLYYGSSSDNKNGDLKAKTRGRTTKRAKSSTAPGRKSKRARAAASR